MGNISSRTDYNKVEDMKKRAKFDALPSPEVSSADVVNISKGDGYLGRVVNWLAQKGVYGAYENRETGWNNIQFDKTSVRSVIKHFAKGGKIALLKNVPALIKDGIFLETKPKNEHGLLSHIFAAKATIDSEPYGIGFVVREDMNGMRYYDHCLKKIAALDEKCQVPQFKAQTESANHESISNILQKHLGVNSRL